MSNKPNIFAHCKAGCAWETVHKSDFELSASHIKQYPQEDGLYLLELGKEYKIFAPKKNAGTEFNCEISVLVAGDGTATSKSINTPCNDEYADSFVFKLLAVKNGYVVYELGGVRYKETTASGTFAKCTVSGATEVLLYNADATIKAEKGDKGDKGDKGESGVPMIETRNLMTLKFTNANLNLTNGGYVSVDTGLLSAATKDFLSVEGGKAYTFSWAAVAQSNMYIFEYDADKSFLSRKSYNANGSGSFVHTLSTSGAYIRVFVFAIKEGTPWEDVVPTNFQMELGTEATEYIPPKFIDPSIIYVDMDEAIDKRIVDAMGDSETDAPSQRATKKAINDEAGKYIEAISSINLFDKTQERESGWILSGNIYADGSRMTVGSMSVSVGKAYTFPIYYSHFGSADAYKISAYDAKGNYVKNIVGTPSGDNKLLTITIPDGICSVKINVSTSTLAGYNGVDEFMFVEGTEYPAEYVSYYRYYRVKDGVVGQNRSKLLGKKIVFTGDSICHGGTDETGVRGWAERIGEKNSMDWQNKAISGATITNGVSGSSGYIVDTDFGENPDYIILEGGTNDADLISTAETFTPDKFGTYNMYDFTSDFDKTTFCGAVEHLFKRVTTDYAGSRIGFIVAHKMGRINGQGDYTKEKNARRFYFETIIALCKKWGIPYLDLWDGCYLCPMNTTHNGGDNPFYYNNDYQHLTARGYDYITPIIEAWIETL